MTDVFSREKRSQVMARIQGRDNRSTERTMAAILRAYRISGWTIRPRDIYGHPDIYLPGHRIALFLDGCFWHGCPKCSHLPAQNRSFWRKKILGNRRRDARTNTLLRKQGLKVMRLWEHDIEKRTQRLTAVIHTLRNQPSPSS